MSGSAVLEDDLPDRSDTALAVVLDEDVDDAPDMVDHVATTKIGARLQRHQRQLIDRARRIVGMDGGHRAGMAARHCTQKRKGLSPAQLAQDDAVGPQTQGCLQEVLGRDPGLALL